MVLLVPNAPNLMCWHCLALVQVGLGRLHHAFRVATNRTECHIGRTQRFDSPNEVALEEQFFGSAAHLPHAHIDKGSCHTSRLSKRQLQW